MKELNFEQMEQVKGGGWLECAVSLGLVAGAGALTFVSAGLTAFTVGGTVLTAWTNCIDPFRSIDMT